MRVRIGQARAVCGAWLALPGLRQSVVSLVMLTCGCLLVGSTPALGQLISCESDVGSKECESSELLAIDASQAQHRRELSMGVPLPVATRGGHRCASAVTLVSPAPAGHRLSNGLCAPLRC
jgi:hypothetical protein